MEWVLTSIVQYICDTHMHWISLQLDIYNLRHHLITRMDYALDVTLIEYDIIFDSLCKLCYMDIAVINASSLVVSKMLVKSDYGISKLGIQLSLGVNPDICSVPLSAHDFPVQGIDVTIYAHIYLPILDFLPQEFQKCIQIIHHLPTQQDLEYFEIIYPTLVRSVTHRWLIFLFFNISLCNGIFLRQLFIYRLLETHLRFIS